MVSRFCCTDMYVRIAKVNIPLEVVIILVQEEDIRKNQT